MHRNRRIYENSDSDMVRSLRFLTYLVWPITPFKKFCSALAITLIYPHIFLAALDIVGGIGETILFVILPGLILVKMNRGRFKSLTVSGYIIASIGTFILFFVIFQKLGITHLTPTLSAFR